MISYYDVANGDLKVAHCSDASCSTSTLFTVDTFGSPGLYTSIAIGADGFPAISYNGGSSLKVAHCTTVSCSSSTVTNTGVAVPFDATLSIAIGTDGYPVISYNYGDLKVAHCSTVSCSASTLTTVDSAGDPGWYSSLVIGADGLPVISYYDSTDGNLRVARCATTNCSPSSNTLTTVDGVDARDAGQYTSIAIGLDGNPIVSYYDVTNSALMVAHCANLGCSAGNTIQAEDTGGDVGQHTSLKVGADGSLLISYYDVTNTALKVARCAFGICLGSFFDSHTLDNTAAVGEYSSLAIGTDGFPVISYYDATNNDLKVAHCGNASCSAGNTLTTVNSVGGRYTSIAIGSDGYPVISHYAGGALAVAHCTNVHCSASTVATAVDDPDDNTHNVGQYTSIAIGTDGYPVISYYDVDNSALKVAHCGNVSCGPGNTLTTVDNSADVGQYTSIAIGTDGFPVVSYYDVTNGVLLVAHCSDASCSAGTTIVGFFVGRYSSIAIGTDGYPVISNYYAAGGDLVLIHCSAANCFSGTYPTVDNAGDVGQYTSIAIGRDDNPVISYYDVTNGNLKVLHCGAQDCSGKAAAGPTATPTRTATATRTNTPANTPTATATGPVDTDGDGCPDASEQQTDPGTETSGGLRDHLNPWDYFNPTHDGINRTDDITRIVQHYGHDDNGDPLYSTEYDRTALMGGYPWQFDAPDGIIRTADISAAVRSYGHDCPYVT